jgi:lycopene cyclase domain-containing protein
LGSVFILITAWQPGIYLSLILAWALPAIMLQLAFGADVLWHYRKLVAWVILPIFLYISATDSLAIASGTWTIDPAQSLEIFIGPLPIEEAVFFLSTVTLIGFGMTLALARISQARWTAWLSRMRK